MDRLLLATLEAPDAASIGFLKEVAALLRVLLLAAFDLLLRGVLLNKGFCKLQYVCLNLFREVLKKGFCAPQKEREEKKKEEEMQDGTGMGEGEGEKDVTDELDGKDPVGGSEG